MSPYKYGVTQADGEYENDASGNWLADDLGGALNILFPDSDTVNKQTSMSDDTADVESMREWTAGDERMRDEGNYFGDGENNTAEDDHCDTPRAPPLERFNPKSTPSPVSPPLVPRPTLDQTILSRKRKRDIEKAERRRTKPTQGERVLLRYKGLNLSDIADRA